MLVAKEEWSYHSLISMLSELASRLYSSIVYLWCNITILMLLILMRYRFVCTLF